MSPMQKTVRWRDPMHASSPLAWLELGGLDLDPASPEQMKKSLKTKAVGCRYATLIKNGCLCTYRRTHVRSQIAVVARVVPGDHSKPGRPRETLQSIPG